MNWIKHIRTTILKATQSELAAIAKTTQSTVDRWEDGRWSPKVEHWAAIREEIIKRGLEWHEDWLFTPPPREDTEAA